MRKDGKALAKFYKIPVAAAYYHADGNCYWNLDEFPGAYFDANGCVVFDTEKDYLRCVWLTIGPNNTGIRGKDAGMSIANIPGYQKLDPPPLGIEL